MYSPSITLLTVVLFALISAGIVLTWNRFFRPVPWRVALILWLLCTASPMNSPGDYARPG